MAKDIQAELALARKRASRYKKARETAEELLESKSRDLFKANQKLEAVQKTLEKDIAQATYELSVTNSRLQRMLDEKSNFIGQMSHEVRTPLNAIIGLSEVLLKTGLSEAQLDYATTINSGANSLVVLLDDMLDITKIEAGRVELKPEPVDMRVMLKNVVTMFQQTAAKKGLSLSLKINAKVPKTLSIDKGRYKQIVNNLISNAVKNTEEGGVVIQLRYTKNTVSEGVGTLMTRVIDSGAGIPKDKLRTIFNVYEQLGQTHQGVGLGLSICQQLSELMMGKITCKSTVGRGSIFEATLPAQELNEVSKKSEENISEALANLPPLKILVAEDNPINQKVITAQLEQLGQSADISNNGAEAFEKLEAQNYDVLICDILMPVLDGEQTIRKIRSSEPRIAAQYCIALTASSYQDQRDKLLNAGFDAFLSKPLSLQELSEALKGVPLGLHLDMPINSPFSVQTVDKKKQKTEQSLFDFSYLKSQFGDAYRGVFAQIAPSFLEHAYKELKELEGYVEAKSHDRIKKVSHSMKGSASSIGLNELAECLLQLEKNPSDPAVETWFQQVRKKMNDLKPVIEYELKECG